MLGNAVFDFPASLVLEDPREDWNECRVRQFVASTILPLLLLRPFILGVMLLEAYASESE